ncbi:right-handed parallel beta-helix repeat-containing protein [Corallococcus sp. CA054B]|uniref:right-handed parallel beta-helix repeat-containing protein n=1 Tax=Corallococcus sp. CA054B TaxID=2316734 RepID=UPI000EA11464|nr:right-handed parallel beta-helix repeat-containing protein [Corallococcus sp. CA054B]RKG68718.1 right-handed parallel beta-helix repeat-containing protein [Corallococcus sp. CA054B]
MRKTCDFLVAMAMATMLMGAPAAQARDAVRFDAEAPVAFNLGGGVVQCGDTLTQHTKLTHDLNCPGDIPFALRIGAEGIVLDLGGHTVRRTGPVTPNSQGIAVDFNSMVRNGTVQGFSFGVVTPITSITENLRLHKLVLLDNGYAVYTRFNTNLLITECRLSGNVSGLASDHGQSSGAFDVRTSVFTHNGTAMTADFHTIDVLDSTFTSNENVLRCLNGSIRIRSSTLAWNASVALLLVDIGGPDTCGNLRFENSLIANNTAFAPAFAPAWQLFRFSMLNSLAVNNGAGLHVAPVDIYMDGNTFHDNAGGLTLSDTPLEFPITLTGIVRGNQFLRNDGDGLRVLAPSTPVLINNVALGNTGWGIHAPTAFNGGGNVARDNGAGDCFGIVCAPY